MPVYGGLVPLGFTHSENPGIHRPDQELLYQIGRKKQGRRGDGRKNVSATIKLTILLSLRSKTINWNLSGSFGTRVDRRLAPRTCEGGVPALAQGRGEYEFPATERQIELSFCVCCSSSRAFVKDMRMTGSPRYQCVLLLPPPHKCGGQGRVPHPPAHHSTNSSTNSNLSIC